MNWKLLINGINMITVPIGFALTTIATAWMLALGCIMLFRFAMILFKNLKMISYKLKYLGREKSSVMLEMLLKIDDTIMTAKECREASRKFSNASHLWNIRSDQKELKEQADLRKREIKYLKNLGVEL